MAETGGETSSGTPRWVKIFAIVALAAVVLVVVLVVTGRGGKHGPGRHTESVSHRARAADVGVGDTSPVGAHTQP